MDCLLYTSYNFFEKNIGTQLGANATNVYVNNVYTEILKLMKNLNDFKGFQTGINQLKGNIAEFWHSGTFNINAVTRGSTNRTFVLQSNEFGSVDIASNFGNDYGLKYYKTGVDSANQQAKSIFEKFKEYQAHGGKDDLNKFLSDRGFSNKDINNAIYAWQYRIIPKEQLEDVYKRQDLDRTDSFEIIQKAILLGDKVPELKNKMNDIRTELKTSLNNFEMCIRDSI